MITTLFVNQRPAVVKFAAMSLMYGGACNPQMQFLLKRDLD